MYKTLMLLLLFISKTVSAQIPIDWAVCVEENNYYYTNANIKDFKKVNERMRFCYNDHYFGFIHSGDNYLQIFPLESYNMGTDNSGNITEGFANGECPNYERGDITVEITHSKPQRIWINYSRQPSYAICIYTNSLYVGKTKTKKPPNQIHYLRIIPTGYLQQPLLIQVTYKNSTRARIAAKCAWFASLNRYILMLLVGK